MSFKRERVWYRSSAGKSGEEICDESSEAEDQHNSTGFDCQQCKPFWVVNFKPSGLPEPIPASGGVLGFEGCFPDCYGKSSVLERGRKSTLLKEPDYRNWVMDAFWLKDEWQVVGRVNRLSPRTNRAWETSTWTVLFWGWARLGLKGKFDEISSFMK